MEAKRSTFSIESSAGLRELRALVTIADAGSFRRAATTLGYSQSAVSHQVATLERALDAALFTRPGGRGAVTLTAAGTAAYREARRALAAVEALTVEVREAGRAEHTRIRVGVSQTAAAELMPAALRVFKEERPGVEVVLTETSESQSLISAIARGRLDLAFAYGPSADDRVDAVPLVEDPFVILVRRDSQLAGVERPTFDLLDGTDVVAWTRGWHMQVELEEALSRRGIAPRIVYRTDDNLALQRFVAAGLGVAVIGLLAARRAIDPGLTWLRPREVLLRRELFLCFPRRRQLSASVSALIAAVRAQAGS